MNPRVCVLLCLLLGGVPAPAAPVVEKAPPRKSYVLYATFVSDTPVELSDGARWLMNRGDSFPVLMFKEQQTRVVLQFAGTQFLTETSRVKITPGEAVTPEMVANYRLSVAGYVDGKSEKLAEQLKPTKKDLAGAAKKKAAPESKKGTPAPRF